jgi:hypothetical protein
MQHCPIRIYYLPRDACYSPYHADIIPLWTLVMCQNSLSLAYLLVLLPPVGIVVTASSLDTWLLISGDWCGHGINVFFELLQQLVTYWWNSDRVIVHLPSEVTTLVLLWIAIHSVIHGMAVNYMYCNVLEDSIQMELYCNSKTQHTTVKHSQQLSRHTYTSNLYGLGTLTPIEFVQQDLFWSSSNTNWPSKTNPIP